MDKHIKCYELLCLLIAVGTASCGSGDPRIFGPRYDLKSPIYIAVEDTLTADGKGSFPHPNEWRQALQNAISLAQGRVTQDSTAAQRITLYNTDGDECGDRKTFAFTDPNSWNRIAICHSLIVFNERFFEPLERKQDLMLHELGHALGGHGGHIGGDDIPNEECPYRNIMAWNLRCHLGITSFKGDDLSYVCQSRYTINGICAAP